MSLLQIPDTRKYPMILKIFWVVFGYCEKLSGWSGIGYPSDTGHDPSSENYFLRLHFRLPQPVVTHSRHFEDPRGRPDSEKCLLKMVSFKRGTAATTGIKEAPFQPFSCPLRTQDKPKIVSPCFEFLLSPLLNSSAITVTVIKHRNICSMNI